MLDMRSAAGCSHRTLFGCTPPHPLWAFVEEPVNQGDVHRVIGELAEEVKALSRRGPALAPVDWQEMVREAHALRQRVAELSAGRRRWSTCRSERVRVVLLLLLFFCCA